MMISVIIPSYNSGYTLDKLLHSLFSNQDKGFEAIVVDDCSVDDTCIIQKKYDVNYIRLDKNMGPAVCRNRGARSARGDILAFTDSDCRVDRNWIKNIKKHFTCESSDALMGKLIIDRSDYLGDSISALGFPAGGSIGFEKIWRVDKKGYAGSLSSCNFAVAKKIFNDVRGFDETFPYAGGEDSFLAYSLVQSGYKIKYCPDVMVHHEARNSLKGYISWQFKRGISSYIFSSKIKKKSEFMSLRLWSISNVLRNNLADKKLPLVFSLLVLGYCTQILGFLYERNRNRN